MVATAPDSGRIGHDELGWTLGVLLRHYQEQVGATLADLPHGHRGYQVLLTVVHGDQRSQLALAGHLGIDRTVMTYLVDDLVAQGLVEREVDPSDRRQRRVVPTAAGRRTLARLEQEVRDAEDRALATLPEDDRATLRRLLRDVACAIRQVSPETDPCVGIETELRAAP